MRDVILIGLGKFGEKTVETFRNILGERRYQMSKDLQDKVNVHDFVFKNEKSFNYKEVSEQAYEEIMAASEAITQIVSEHRQVGWTENKTIHDRISQDIDDLFYAYEKNRGVKLPFDVIDKIIDNVLTVAIRRF